MNGLMVRASDEIRNVMVDVPTGSGDMTEGLGMAIGMDAIGKGDFAVSGHDGKTIFSCRHPSVPDIELCEGSETDSDILTVISGGLNGVTRRQCHRSRADSIRMHGFVFQGPCKRKKQMIRL